MHNSTPIGLESLKDLFPENQKMNSGEIIHAAFHEVHPGRKDYMNHPSIKKFLQETSLDPLASGKRERVDYCGSSACEWEIGNTKTWFGCGAMRCSDPEQVEEIFRSGDVAHRQLNTLGLASVISFSCASSAPFEPESAASNTMAVEVLVHSSKMIRHGTLEAWLDPFLNPRIVKFEWKPVRTGKGNSYMQDPTVQKFLDETMLDPAATAALAGKRQRVDLASPSSITLKKAGQKPGWKKPRPGDDADAAGPGNAVGSAVAAANATPSATPRRSLSSGSAAVNAEPATYGGVLRAGLGADRNAGRHRGREGGRGRARGAAAAGASAVATPDGRPGGPALAPLAPDAAFTPAATVCRGTGMPGVGGAASAPSAGAPTTATIPGGPAVRHGGAPDAARIPATAAVLVAPLTGRGGTGWAAPAPLAGVPTPVRWPSLPLPPSFLPDVGT